MLEVLAFAGLVTWFTRGAIVTLLKRRKAAAPWNGYVDSVEYYNNY